RHATNLRLQLVYVVNPASVRTTTFSLHDALPISGVVTFTQVNNIWHSDTSNPDDAATLTLSDPSLLQVVQTLTDADGDSASTPLDLNTALLTFNHDCPAASTLAYVAHTLVLDESR